MYHSISSAARLAREGATRIRQYISIQPRVLSKTGGALPLSAFCIAQLE
jgi:hypothetical protein